MKTFSNIKDFDAVTMKLASPERIKEWSYGEITKPETINYRTGRSERGGLFDEKIFGPEKDYECYCGKYRRIRYKDIICEKCGVEVTRSIVRRERMGHIELAFPVAHIWFVRGIPSKMGLVLNLSVADLEKVIYFAGYIITKVNEDEKRVIYKELDTEYKTKLKQLSLQKEKDVLKELLTATKKELDSLEEGKVIDEVTYHRYSLKYGHAFEAGIGSEALYNILKNIDLKKMKNSLEESFSVVALGERARVSRKLSLINAMIAAQIKPEWMFFSSIPVIPPALRPMVALEGGRHATSDVNDLYRRVINRNNRLKKLKDIGAPDVILRNEKRILQEAVDALIDNSIRHGVGSGGSAAMSSAQKRALKSLADALKGKHGLFRQNLLGKRVDYSGRSVIVVGPDLKLHQCGLPKHMALELFRPFVISKLIKRELAFNIRGAGRLIDEGIPEVWAILEEVIHNKYVLLNRAPTLHRLGIQAFQPVLIEGNAIQVHPLVCPAFNADFDGDQMAVHVPLSDKAQKEARELMSAARNLLKPGNGDPTVNPSLDIVLGAYWMTKMVDGEQGEGKYFPSPNTAITAQDFKIVGLRTKINVLGTDSPKYAEFNGIFETTVGRLLFNSVLPKDFPYLNKEITKKIMGGIVEDLISRYGIDNTPAILDKIKAFGYKYVTQSGITWGIDDVLIPEGKKDIVDASKIKEAAIWEQFNEGLLSNEERYRKIIEIWQGAANEIESRIPGSISKNGSVSDMVSSGARGSMKQIVQMSGMKGLIINPAGIVFDFPIIPSNKEGLSPIEYFITTHGSRKGLADTALNTAKAGYLTRRLVNVAQDVVVTEYDCKTKDGKIISAEDASGIKVSLAKNIRGRVLAKDILGYKHGEMLSKEISEEIEKNGVTEVFVRSPLRCQSKTGICQMCYGRDLGRDGLVKIGEAVGIIAAQAIGEPGTQLTMRTFHSGGIASVGGDITMGLPRVEEVFERRAPRVPAVVCHSDGEIVEIRKEEKEQTIVVLADVTEKKSGSNMIEYSVPFSRMPLIKKGERVKKGQMLTDGQANLLDVFLYGGRQQTEEYIVSEITKIYELQGASISRKHIELIIRQMFSRVKIKNGGDTGFSIGEIVPKSDVLERNDNARKEKGLEASFDSVLLGISEVTLSTQSFLSAASFQHTSRTLINTAIRGGVDMLRGLNENVIIGRLIPAGTGYNKSDDNQSNNKDEDAVIGE